MRSFITLSGAEVVSVGQIVDKDLFARLPLYVFSYPQALTKFKTRNVSRGERVGSVYSYVTGRDKDGNKNSELWWMLYPSTPGGKFEYVKQTPVSFVWDLLHQQGSQTEEEIAQEKADAEKDFLDKLFDKLGTGISKTGKTALWIGGSALALYLGIKLYKEFKKP